MIKVFEAFAGYGSQSIALRNLGIEHDVVAISETDPDAIIAYGSIRYDISNYEVDKTLNEMREELLEINVGWDFKKQKSSISRMKKEKLETLYKYNKLVNNLGDISKIDLSCLVDLDLFTYSFPCTDISVAGKQEGLVRGGTRSGLLYECEKVIENCRPKTLLLENVKNLVGKKFRTQFDEWLEYLESLGYTNYWKVINSKDMGVPQNRERVFVVSILGEHEEYKFPEKQQLNKAIKDVLEDNVDDKYYIDKEFKFVENKGHQAEFVNGTFEQNKRIYSEDNKIMRTLGAAERGQNNIIVKARLTDLKYGQTNQILDSDGICTTLDTMQGGYRQPKILCEGNVNPSGNGMNGNVFNEEGISPTLTTNKGEGPKILCEKITQYVEVRKHEVDIPNLQKCLAKHKLESNLTNSQIADVLLINKTTVDHWFRTDESFSIPSKEIWKELKTLLNIGTKEFDESIMEFEIKENEYDTSNRAYRVDGIAPTLTCDNESTAKKIICEARTDEGLRFFKNNICGTIRTIDSGGDKRIIEIPQATKKGYIEMEIPGVVDLSYPNSKTRRGRVKDDGKIAPTLTAATQDICYVDLEDNIELPCIAASRGRNPENPTSRITGDITEQRIEINKKGVSNTITTVQKDNYVIENKDKQYQQDNEIYDGDDIAMCLTDEAIINDKESFTYNPIGENIISQMGGDLWEKRHEQTRRVYDIEKVSPTIPTCTGGGVQPKIFSDYTIRKLTPRECYRLMGMRDDDIDKIQAAGVSNSQQYKMAGNSIVVNVLEGIFKNLFI